MVTALSEYLYLLAVYPEAYVNLILLVIILVEYLHLWNAKLQFSDTHFSNFSPIFPEFTLCFYPPIFLKNLLAKSAQP